MVGAGQLARMSHQAAVDLDVDLLVLAASGEDPAVAAGASFRLGSPQKLADLASIAAEADVLTFDHELVAGDHLRALERRGFRVRPSAAALAVAQDKLHARTMLQHAGFPVPPFGEVRDAPDARRFAEQYGWPIVLKAPRGGYDGRGVHVVTEPSQLGHFFPAAERTASGRPPGASRGKEVWLAEAYLRIERELAVLVARREDGASAVYPVVESHQRHGICVELVQPAPIPAALAQEATRLATDLAAGIGATGICAVELFCQPDGNLIVNECALRPHNSGHATIEACVTSQFHQHLRAVLDWPLGDTSLVVPAAAMVNLIGGEQPVDPAERLAERDLGAASVHLYGKTTRPGRKIGHVTALGATTSEALGRAREAAAALIE